MADTRDYTIVITGIGDILVRKGDVWERFVDDVETESIHYVHEASEVYTLVRMGELTEQQAAECFYQISVLVSA